MTSGAAPTGDPTFARRYMQLERLQSLNDNQHARAEIFNVGAVDLHDLRGHDLYADGEPRLLTSAFARCQSLSVEGIHPLVGLNQNY
jgi:hypothetical protein